MIQLASGLHYGVDVTTYRADPGLNQSLVKAFGSARTPAHFKYDRDHPSEETPELRMGSAVDCEWLTPGLLKDRFITWPGERRGKEWAAFKEAHPPPLSILNGPENDKVNGMVTAVRRHSDAERIRKVCHQQVVAIADHPAGFRMKALFDLLPDPKRCDPMLTGFLFDLKTSGDASAEGFAMQAWRLSYAMQGAWYLKVLQLCGVNAHTFGFIVVESDPPHEVNIHYFRVDAPEVQRAMKRCEELALRYLECMKANAWPGYGDEWQEIRFKHWQLEG